MTITELKKVFQAQDDENVVLNKWIDLTQVSSIVLENNVSLYPNVDKNNDIKTQYYFDESHELLFTRFVKNSDDSVLTSVNEAIDIHTIISFVFVSDINIKNPPKFGASI